MNMVNFFNVLTSIWKKGVRSKGQLVQDGGSSLLQAGEKREESKQQHRRRTLFESTLTVKTALKQSLYSTVSWEERGVEERMKLSD